MRLLSIARLEVPVHVFTWPYLWGTWIAQSKLVLVIYPIAKIAMNHRDQLFRILKQVFRVCVGFVLLSGCALNQSREDILVLEKRVAKLESEVRQLHADRRSAAADANLLNEQGLGAQLSALFKERQQLLKTYTRQHPSIKLLDLKIEELSQSGTH